MYGCPIGVLLVDDDPDDFVLTRDFLQEIEGVEFMVTWIADYQTALKTLIEQPPEVALIDYRLGEHNGLELLQQAMAAGCRTPMILLTGQGDRLIDLEAMRGGAADYLDKSQLTPPLLERSIRFAIERQQTQILMRQQAEREHLVTQIAQRIRQTLNLGEVLCTTVAEVRQFLQVERTFIYRFQPDWSGFVVVESVDPRWKSIQGRVLTDPEFAEFVQDYKQGRIQATADIYAADLADCYVEFLAQFQVRATLVVPILQGDNLWGLLVANQCSAPRVWQPFESQLLEQLATQVAIAIQQSELFQQVQTELSERKQAEAKISQQAALLDVATDAILVQDLQQRILFWNKGAERLYGWPPEAAIAQNATQLFYREPPAELAPIQRVLATQGSWQGELHQITRTGQEIIVASRWTLVRDAAGAPTSILVVNTDITANKQLEAQFLRAQRMESIGALASGIAHDLNNILSPILMAVELLEQKVSNPQGQQLLAILATNAKRGAELVRQVLSFARGFEGRQTVLQLRHLILEVGKTVKATFPKSIQVRTTLLHDLWTISGDATQLHQVLMNLCVNARDAMPEGGTLSLTAENLWLDQQYVEIHPEAHVGPYVVVTVADTGMGIPPELLERVFEPFFTTKELGKGTGLGLSTVQSILKNHNGFVTLSSQVGVGTQFKLYFPALPTAEAHLDTDQEPPAGQGELILFVDDEAAIREITKTSLETYGYRVVTASDGVEAVTHFARQQDEIAVVVTDMMMPAMDGPTLIRTLQKLNPQVKIIAVSGLEANERLAAVTGTGVQGFLLKPYTARDLLSTLHQVLSMPISGEAL